MRGGVRAWLVLALATAVVAPAQLAHGRGAKKAAKGDKKDKKDKADDDADSSDSDDSSSDDDSDKKPKKAAAKAAPKKADKKADKKDDSDDDADSDKGKDKDKDSSDDEGGGGGGGGDDEGGEEEGGGGPSGKGRDAAKTKDVEPVKQDLNGHDLGTRKKVTEFEKDRFFVDKSDTEATENKTLIQGSLTSSSFLYAESAGQYPGTAMATDQSGPHRLFTDLRLQTDFRHIAASRWDFRIDGRARFVSQGNPANEPNTTGTPPDTHLQSGFNGTNEYELRELWLVRNGERTDVTIGRQFIADLAAVKIDGMRIDYASSNRLTYLGFAGLYPLRGSRSLTTDYVDLKDPATGMAVGKLVGSGGFGAAYRTDTMYGAFGGVALVPLQTEQPRVFATSNGYWRPTPTIDLYHYALIDLVSSYGAQLTNLSGGINWKPAQRLRMTASYNRVDTDTLNITAAAFLDQAQANPVIQNEILLARLATTQGRGSISAGLGNLQRFEITVATAYRTRPSILLNPVGGGAGVTLPAAKSVEVFGSIIDRHSFKDTRIGVDAVQTFGVGSVAYQRDEVFALRGFVGRELDSGNGEWEAEVSYATTKDTNVGNGCTNVADCYGSTSGTVISAGGTLYYRINRDWFTIAQLFINRTTLARMAGEDPAINGLSGYFRIAYRF